MQQLTEDQRALIALPETQQVIARVVHKRIRRWRPLIIDAIGSVDQAKDEMLSQCFFDLCLAARHYQPSSVPWLTVVGSTAVRACLHWMHGRSRFLRGGLTFKGPRRTHIPTVATIDQDFRADELPIGWEMETEESLRHLVACLPEPEAFLILAYYLNTTAIAQGRSKMPSDRVLAERLGISHDVVSKRRKSALAKIRHEYQSAGVC